MLVHVRVYNLLLNFMVLSHVQNACAWRVIFIKIIKERGYESWTHIKIRIRNNESKEDSILTRRLMVKLGYWKINCEWTSSTHWFSPPSNRNSSGLEISVWSFMIIGIFKHLLVHLHGMTVFFVFILLFNFSQYFQVQLCGYLIFLWVVIKMCFSCIFV